MVSTRLILLVLSAGTAAPASAQVAARPRRHADVILDGEIQAGMAAARAALVNSGPVLAAASATMQSVLSDGRLQAALANANDRMMRFNMDASLAAARAGLAAAANGLAGARVRVIDRHSDNFDAYDAFDGFDDMDATPPEPWAQQDPANQLYRDAKSALNQSNYTRAADLYSQIYSRYPKSSYAPDAYYWQAFALSKRGGESTLKRALDILEMQRDKAPQASTRDEARELRVRIQGMLARNGDPAAAAAIASTARGAAAPMAPAAVVAPATPGAPTAPVIASSGSRRSRGSKGECESEDDIQTAALNALQQMDGDKATPILKKVLARRDPESVCLRRKAVFLVSQHEGNGTEDVLLEAARNDPDQEVREQAVFWLSQVDSPAAIAALDSILRSSTDAAVQDKAIFAISQHESARARQILRDFALRTTVSDELREKAIFWIGQNDDPANIAALKAIYGAVKSENLKDKVLFSISQNDAKESIQWLMQVAGDANESIELRKKALFWAGQHGGDEPELLGLYEKMPNKEMKEQLIFVYSQMDKKPAVDKLISIARTESDRDLRKKAIFWLSQSDDPRVAEFLASLLEKP